MALGEARIQLCGRVVVRLGERRVEDRLPGRQGRLVFVYLALNRQRPVRRDELVDALWGDEVPVGADASLSALLSKLRSALGANALEGRAAVRLALPDATWIDVEAASEALHRAESALAREDWRAAWGPARVAQHVTVRGFLPGEDLPWVAEQRDRLAAMYVRALELAAEASLRIGGSEIDTAERSARRLVERAPYRESGYRLLMETLAERGERAEALQVYERLRILLRDELGAAPSPTTQDVHRRLLL